MCTVYDIHINILLIGKMLYYIVVITTKSVRGSIVLSIPTPDPDSSLSKGFWFQTWYDNFETDDRNVLKYQFVRPELRDKITRQRVLRPGRAGPVHHGNQLYEQKETFFVNSLRNITLSESSIWRWKEALDYELGLRGS